MEIPIHMGIITTIKVKVFQDLAVSEVSVHSLEKRIINPTLDKAPVVIMLTIFLHKLIKTIQLQLSMQILRQV